MSRRIDIELTSSLGDGTWTWRAAGAKQPKGVLSGSILPDAAKVGDVLKVEVEQEIDGITVLNVVYGREKQDPKGLLSLLPIEREFQPVVETRAHRERGDRPDRGDRGDRPRRDRPPRGDRPDRGDRPRDGQSRGDNRGGDGRGDSRNRADNRAGTGGRRDGGRERRGPSFTPPPEVPQRPKPKRLRPGKTHRTAVLADLPPEQRPIAELTLQGIGAVRQRLKEENAKAVAEGRAAMPEASVMKMAEELLPRLRVAEWRDRADAAKAQADDLDLRDLRSVVAASDDPIVARDETTRSVAEELKVVLAHKQEQELLMWFGDIDAALAVGRVIRALRLSSQPPKAGVPFPSDISQRLVESTNASLAPMDAPDRWAAMLEAAAFSPIRSLIKPLRKPDVVNDDLLATVKRLAPALPHVAALFEIVIDPKAPMPKPLRPTSRPTKGGKPGDAKPEGGDRAKRGDRPPRSPKPERGPKPAPDAAASAPIADPPATVDASTAPDDKSSDTVDAAPAAPDTSSDTVDAAPAAPNTSSETVDAAPVAPDDTSSDTVDAAPAAPDTSSDTVDATPTAPDDTSSDTVDATPTAPDDTSSDTVDATPTAPDDTSSDTVDATPTAPDDTSSDTVDATPTAPDTSSDTVDAAPTAPDDTSSDTLDTDTETLDAAPDDTSRDTPDTDTVDAAPAAPGTVADEPAEDAAGSDDPA